MTPHRGSGRRLSAWWLPLFFTLATCSRTSPEPVPRGVSNAPAGAKKLGSTALPATPASELERHASCAEKQCRLDAWLPDPSFAKTTLEGKDSPLALFLEELAPGSTLVIPRHQELEVLGVVLAGTLWASTEEADYTIKLGVWDAFRMPGAGCLLRAGASRTKALLAVVTDKPSLSESLERGRTRGFEVRWKKRPAPPESAVLTSATDLGWGGGAFHARIGFGGEGAQARRASLEALLMAAGSSIPEHDHPSWEHIALLTGSGRFKLGAAEYPVKPGSIFHIPIGVRHAFTGDPGSEVLAVQLYSPSGPEQRFVKLAKESAKPGQ